ncbi:AAEL010503-PA [Aedes aegypti]|uniref:AAEL010503-PA n=1 Tax=Aedes aegypti TaxID=7159 RepID=Q16SS5_AEDAE|nr:AAEL010503-PA [Aedes aegypti]
MVTSLSNELFFAIPRVDSNELELSAQEERNGRDEGKCGMCGLSSKCNDYCNRTAGTWK